MRLPNGYGSVFKLPGKRRNPWVARVTTGWKKTIATRGKDKGKEVRRQVYRIIGYYPSKPDALAALGKNRMSPTVARASMTMADLYKEWSEVKFNQIEKATENNYRAAWIHLEPISKLKAKEVRSSHIQTVIDNCQKNGLSRSSLEKIRAVSVMLFDYAVQNDILPKNYAKFIKLPKHEKAPKDRFTALEIKALFDRAGDDRWTSSILIMIYTGLRITEMLELTRFNVDLKAKTITGGIKTEAGKNRVIPIHSKILPYVKEWLKRGGDALICDDKGKKLSSKRYREKFYYPALEGAEVRKLTPHKCRHTFCTMLAEKGADTLSIQILAGHADYGFTANEYTHPEIEKLRKAIHKI